MEIVIDRNIYTDSCISKTIYSFLKEYCFERSLSENEETILVSSSKEIPSSFREIFLSRLNDYKLRCIIEEETKDIRTILYAKAFADCEDLSEEEIL